VPVIPPGPDGTVQSARNFLGFRDGSANPDAGDVALMDRLVWVGDNTDEPAWTAGGSYQAIRIIRNFVERWDRTPLREQEAIMGRVKNSGAPLDKRHGHEFMVPDFAGDPKGEITPLDAHIRLANPRTDRTRESLILRRPFNYSNGVTKAGQVDQGLLFICYQADLDRGFIAIQRRLDGEPLEEYIKPVGGGYFYALPGVRDDTDHLGSALITAARANREE
jgi:deferrochelatase/peroxidase EfeB